MICPSCGYCPHCGRSNPHPSPYVPFSPYITPPPQLSFYWATPSGAPGPPTYTLSNGNTTPSIQ